MALPSGWTREALEREVLDAPWRVPSVIPDTVVTIREGWRQKRTPSLTQGGMNEISHVRLADDVADATVDRAIEEFRGSRFRVVIDAGTRPSDLAERLARRGFVPAPASGVARDLKPVSGPERVRVDVATDEASADEFSRVMEEGWERGESAFTAMHRAMVTSPHYRLFVARIDGEAAGAAAYALGGKTAYLIGGVVLPRFRRRGAYQALVAARIADARARGAELATSHARAQTSAPILLRLGFEVVCDLTIMLSPE